jgi:hypothetical protein
MMVLFTSAVCAQSLAPRAYIITATNSNAVTLTWSFYDGGVNLNGALPVTNAKGTYYIATFSYYHSLSFFARSSNITVSLPYGVGTFSGKELGEQKSVYRSGLLDFSARFSVNLKGGPAMKPQQLAKWRQKVLLGASVTVIAPTGQYDGTKLVNWGINRWAVKPEFAYSQRWRHWVLDAYGECGFYTTNGASYDLPVPRPQTEEPIGSFEGHWSYDFKKQQRMWASLDGNFWWAASLP